MPLADDAEIVKHVEEITILLIDRAGITLATGNLGCADRPIRAVPVLQKGQ